MKGCFSAAFQHALCTDIRIHLQSVTYGSGFFLGECIDNALAGAGSSIPAGTLWNDSVKIGDLSLPKQGVGAALPLLSFGFANVDGILGFVSLRSKL